jgi:hypothetical protein
MRNRASLLILVVIFAVMVVVTLVQNGTLSFGTAPTVEVQMTPFLHRVFPDMAVLDIQAIRLFDPNTERSFDISRTADGSWTALGLYGTLDAKAATAIASTVVLMPYQRSLPLEETTKLEDFGFRPQPNLLVAVLLANGEQHAIVVGGVVATQAQYYALADDRKEIYLLERGAVDFLANYLELPPVTPVAPEATPEVTPAVR